MTRLYYYTAAFIISLIVFILFHFTGIIDILIFISFALSSIILVYSRDEMPKSKKSLQIPQVHYYYKSRLNIYGYLMATLLVVISISYTLISFILSLRQGIVALFLWFVSIIATYFIVRFTSQKINQIAIADYILEQEQSLENDKYDEAYTFLEYLISVNVKLDNVEKMRRNIINFATKIGLDKKNANEILEDYLYYTSSTSEKLTSSEINAINDKLGSRD